jgi:hypothetical protein
MQSLREALLLGLRDRGIAVFAVKSNAEDDLALLAYGSVVVAAPQLLPTFPAGHDKDMPVDMQMQMPKPK